MLDMEIYKLKKTIEKKKHSWVINLLKESIEATAITKLILNLGINLTIGKLLALALAIKKQLLKAVTENKAIQFRVNCLKSSIFGA